MSQGLPPRAVRARGAANTEAENNELARKARVAAALAEQNKAKAAAARIKRDAVAAKKIGDETNARRDIRVERYAKRKKPQNIFDLASIRYDHRAQVAYTTFKDKRKRPDMTIEEYSRLEQMADEYNTVLLTYDEYLSSKTPSKRKRSPT